LEMGISINPGNVDWYKRTLIQSQSAPAMAWSLSKRNGMSAF
jgi:hypothetical protein